MQVEDIARISLSARRTPNQQRNRAVCDRVLREIVVDNQHMLTAVHKELAHRATRIGCDVLQRARLRSRCRDDNRVVHRTGLFERIHQCCDGGTLLSDCDINTNDILALLVQDGVECNRRLSGLAVADDQLSLTASDRDHRVDCLDARLHRLLDRLTLNNARRRTLDRAVFLTCNRACAVNRLTDCVDHTAEQRFADRNRDHAPRALYGLSFLNTDIRAEQHRRDAVFLQILCHTEAAILKFEELTGHAVRKTGNSRNSVADREHRPGFVLNDGILVVFNLASNDLRDLF